MQILPRIGPGARERLIAAGVTLSLLFAGCALAQTVPARMPAPIEITVDASDRANYTIPRTLFGTFLEPIGNSTYNGLWAEILQNPSLEENLWSASRIAQMIQEEPSLARASELGLPIPWEPLDPAEGNRYEPRWGNAANSWRSLAIFGVPGSATGIRQKVYLPVHRELRYLASVYARHLSGPNELKISLRRREEKDLLVEASVQADDANWRKYNVRLTVPQGRMQALEPAELVVRVAEDERVELDQLSLVPADAIDGMDRDIIRMSKELGTPLVRFGGNYTSAYHWRDGVGPRDKRVNMLNIAWGIPEYNQFGTDEFLRYCQLIGAEPQIALNLGSGTPAEAADWVRYVNEHWTRHSGLLWELGNELWGNWNLASPTLAELPERTRRFSEAIRAVDPAARLIATGQDPDHYKEWNAAQLTNPPGTFDFLATHFVVTTDRVGESLASPESVAADSFAMPVELGRRLREMQKQIEGAPGYAGKARLAFTEWLWVCCSGRKIGNAPKWDNLGGAITTAGFLNMLLDNADVVPISDMTGIVEFAGIWKKRGRVFGTPAYYTFRLYATSDIQAPVKASANAGSYDVKQGVTRVPEIPNVPYLDVAAALNRSGDKLTLFCINRHLDQDVPSTLMLKGFAPNGKAEVDSLSSESIYDVNDETEPEAIVPVHASVALEHGTLHYAFPHASITRIELRKR